MSATNDAIPAPSLPVGVSVYRGLLWREWLAHGRLVVGALAVWLVCGWVLLLFFHPGMLLAFGVLLAMAMGAVFGGDEAAEGSEEFAFGLPPTRSERYLARMLIGGATVLGFTVLGELATGLDLPQRLWSLVVETGYTEPFPVCEHRFLHVLAVALPFAIFAFTFALAAHARSRGLVWVSWILGAGIGAGVMCLGFLAERLLWGETLNGYVSCAALFALAPAALLAGHALYVRKEGVSRPAPSRGHTVGCVLIVVVVVVVLVILMLFWTYTARVSHESMDEARRTATVEEQAEAERRAASRIEAAKPDGGP